MHRLKPIVCKTPEELAAAMGLSAAEAKEWQLQHALLKRLKEIVLRPGITHAEVAKRAGTSRTRVTAILNDDLDHVSSDLLVRILAGLGYRVRVSVVKSDTAAGNARSSVESNGSLVTHSTTPFSAWQLRA